MQRLSAVCGLRLAAFGHATAALTDLGIQQSQVLSLYENGTAQVDDAFRSVYDHFAKTFEFRDVRRDDEGVQEGRRRVQTDRCIHIV